MSEIHRFIFEGLPVRGVFVRLTESWKEILKRKTSGNPNKSYPLEVQNLLGEMMVAATLMQANIKFNGSLILQIMGDGPVKIAVAEVQSNFGLRAMATVVGDLPLHPSLSDMVNQNNQGKCAITLDAKNKVPGQHAYQGVVPLFDDKQEKIENLSDILEHYMLQSEQLDTRLVLAANDQVSAGLLIQRLPLEGSSNLAGSFRSQANEDEIGINEDYNRIALLTTTLKQEELLTLDPNTLLYRLYWQEKVNIFKNELGAQEPHFLCTCSRDRVSSMIYGLGEIEAESILEEQGSIGVGCEFCGSQYAFDKVDVGHIFKACDRNFPDTDSVQ